MSDPAAPKKKMTPSERARHASLVRWGKEQPFAARLAAVREARKKKKGRAAPKPKAKKQTPEERAALAEKERQANIAAVDKAMQDADAAVGPTGLKQILALSQGAQPDKAMADGLVSLGMASISGDGRVMLSPEGRALVRAAERGDATAALDAISKAGDKTKGEKEKPDAEASDPEKEEEKPKGGGGGGGGSAKPSEEEKDAEKVEARKQKAQDTAATVGMAQEELDALRTARDEGGVSNPALVAAGLIGPDGLATDQGRRALTALENGNVGQYRAALQDAQGRMGREKESEQRSAESESRSKERETEQAERRTKRDVQIAKRETDKKKREQDRLDEAERRKTERRSIRVVKMEDEIEQILELAESEIKAGSVLSAANADALLTAYEATDAALERIGAVLEAAGLFDEDEEEETIEGGEVELIEGKADPFLGGEIKALGGDRIGGYAVLFGAEDTHDASEMRDFFTKSTDFWLDHFGWPRPMTYHHGLEPATKDAPIVGHWASARVDDVGVWMEGELNRAHKYHNAVKELVRRGYLKLSSDSAPQWVIREKQPSGSHFVKRWPLITASPTVTPAEPRMMGLSFKALLADLGLEDIDTEAEPTEAAREGVDHALKAETDRATRLSLENELITIATLEATWTH